MLSDCQEEGPEDLDDIQKFDTLSAISSRPKGNMPTKDSWVRVCVFFFFFFFFFRRVIPRRGILGVDHVKAGFLKKDGDSGLSLLIPSYN